MSSLPSDIPPQPPAADLLAFGQILKPRGLAGEMKVRLLCNGPEHFLLCVERECIRLWRDSAEKEARAVSIGDVRFHQGFALIHMEGIDSIEKAEPLRGCLLGLPANEAPPSDEESWYFHDLEGLTVIDAEGRVLGMVEKVEEGPAHDQLLVRPEGGGKVFRIPLVAAFVKEVDITARRVETCLPPGLIESQE
ncbi:16S rRNA processing protein RimM [bacterium]|nr:16S rRNA processing protein RimM [bacterium]